MVADVPTIKEEIARRIEAKRRFLAAHPRYAARLWREPKSAKASAHERRLRAALGTISTSAELRDKLPELIPCRPYCTDRLPGPVYVRRAEVALQCRFIQLNGPNLQVWLLFDIDRPAARAAFDEVAPPNFIAVNPENGHAHLAYLLKVPILKNARPGPVNFAADVESGMQRRLSADTAYSGLLIKNPMHEAWHVTWKAPTAYLLADLAKTLTRDDISHRERCRSLTTGLGRNVTMFDETRQWAYLNVLTHKRNGGTREGYQ